MHIRTYWGVGLLWPPCHSLVGGRVKYVILLIRAGKDDSRLTTFPWTSEISNKWCRYQSFSCLSFPCSLFWRTAAPPWRGQGRPEHLHTGHWRKILKNPRKGNFRWDPLSGLSETFENARLLINVLKSYRRDLGSFYVVSSRLRETFIAHRYQFLSTYIRGCSQYHDSVSYRSTQYRFNA